MTDDNAEEGLLLPRKLPFIAQDAEPPGRLVDGKWHGEKMWCTRHGQAVVDWLLGKPTRVHSARCAGGHRADVYATFDDHFSRYDASRSRQVIGDLELRSYDVLFHEDPSRKAQAAEVEGPNLEEDLARDHQFLAALEDDRFARAMYRVFLNRTFYKEGHEQPWICGDRQAAQLVACLRNRGETYLNFYLQYEFPGYWPDDRPEYEAKLRQEIERASEPIVFSSRETPPFTVETADGRREDIDTEERFQSYLERRRREFEESRGSLEAARRKSIENAKRRLEEFEKNENADVFEALHQHITRLRWRTEDMSDRTRSRRRMLDERVRLLREIKRLDTRPQQAMPKWVYRVPASVRRGSDRTFTVLPADWNDLTEEERAAHPHLLVSHLETLACNGQLSSDEYRDLLERITKVKLMPQR
ncbi:MAG: hypothetical protein ACTS10_09595 [Kiloniellales bacterium]